MSNEASAVSRTIYGTTRAERILALAPRFGVVANAFYDEESAGLGKNMLREGEVLIEIVEAPEDQKPFWAAVYGTEAV